MKIFLDSDPLGLITNQNMTAESIACKDWMERMIAAGHWVALPEVIDYEIRRELLRAEKSTGLARLDEIKEDLDYVPLDTATMLLAAKLWAEARKRGQPTADKLSLDIDVILAAQALQCREDSDFVIVATLNKKHLSQFVPAENWKDIHTL